MRFYVAFAILLVTSWAVAQKAVIQYNPASKTPQVVQVGDNFVVSVNAMPGAGYSWDIWKNGREGLSLIGKTSAPVNKGAIGGPEKMTYVFRATAAGKPVITMVYGRPWELEKGATPTKTLTIPVIVK